MQSLWFIFKKVTMNLTSTNNVTDLMYLYYLPISVNFEIKWLKLKSQFRNGGSSSSVTSLWWLETPTLFTGERAVLIFLKIVPFVTTIRLVLNYKLALSSSKLSSTVKLTLFTRQPNKFKMAARTANSDSWFLTFVVSPGSAKHATTRTFPRPVS